MINEEKKGNTFHWDYITIGFFYLAAIIFLYQTFNLQQMESRIFPYIVLSLAIILNTVLLVKSIKTSPDKREQYSFEGGNRALYITAALLIYVIAIGFIGFYIATPVYLYLTMFMLGQRKQKVLIPVALITTLFVYVVFDLVLSMPIPGGMLF